MNKMLAFYIIRDRPIKWLMIFGWQLLDIIQLIKKHEKDD